MIKIQLEEVAEGVNVGDSMQVILGGETLNYTIKKIETWNIKTEQGEDGYSILSIEKQA
jgi:hypothetical protein